MEIREALEAAIGSDDIVENAPQPPVENAPQPPVENAPQPPVENASEPPVENASEPPVENAPQPPVEKASEPPVEKVPEHGQSRVDRPPASWKKQAKGEWAALPLHVRQEVYRREGEINRVLRETGEARQTVEQFHQTVAPYLSRIQSYGISPLQAVDELFRADALLATGTGRQKAEMLAKLVSDYGVDVKDLDDALAASLRGAQQPQPTGLDPSYVNQLVQQQLQQALGPIYQERQQQQQLLQQQAAETVEDMSLNPAYPYFDDLRQEMADLIEVAARRGVVLSLADAYTRAAMVDPAVSEQQSRQTSVANANQQHQQAQRAKMAGSSVTGSPAGGGSQTMVGDGSLRGAIEAAFGNNRV